MVMAVQYSKRSSYGITGFRDHYLDLMVNRPIPKLDSDVKVTITQTYHMRPDLLAFDLYEDSELWWVFAQRNPNILKNPLIDFSAGTEIQVPDIDTLREVLGF
jgi:hypothetical protein